MTWTFGEGIAWKIIGAVVLGLLALIVAMVKMWWADESTPEQPPRSEGRDESR